MSARRFGWLIALLVLAGCSCERDERPAIDEVSAEDEDVETGEPVLGLSPREAARVIARIDERTITLGDIAVELASQSGPNRARRMLPAHRHEVLDAMVRRILLADEARRLGLGESDAVRRARRTALAQMLGALWLDDPTVVTPPSDAEIAAYYEAHRGDFSVPRRRRCRYLVSRDPEALAEGLARLVADPGSSSLYRSLSESLPVDPPRYGAAGETPEFSDDPADPAAQALPNELQRLAFEVDVSAWIDHPIRGEREWMIAQVVAETPSAQITLEQAADSIRAILRRDSVAQAARRLIADRGEELSIDEDALAAVRFPE